jgi:cell wall-associated NlpC family hydrolase
MPNKALVAAGAAFVLPFALVVTVAVQTTTGNAAASSDPNTGAIGGGLRPGSVPAPYAPWIERAAGACPGLPAPVLAAQLHQESGFRPDAMSDAGAEGIAQFTAGTWATWGTDADGNGVASPFDPADAITAQGRLMCALLGKGRSSGYADPPIEQALAGYNAGWQRVVQYEGVPPQTFAGGQTYRYVHAIMDAAATYSAPVTDGGPVAMPADFTLPASTPAPVRTAIEWALRQRGTWYHLGGTCTNAHGTDPAHWCDCSSLVQQAYRAAGIALPRTTFAQIAQGQPIAVDAPLPGDLVFSPGADGTPTAPGHVALYIGQGLLLEAPHTGAQVRLTPYAAVRNARTARDRVTAIRRVVPQ